ncbi:hypothetical protein BKM03_21435 [Pseudomonas avellanae]|uniref:Uncharacterized protein n=1 Tax=Pseudomonas avellanae TaxID=46257 RepID=A0AAD0E3L5_9PSED|nr:hypothetical protein BKM03_21435 [Pseudomonas avellanae]POP75450.1 hypothetical protein CXB34_28095 [Pseudomonas amygdali pv. morsprunorum]
MRQWPVLDEFGATVREVGSLSHARHFAGGLDWREECWVSSSSTIVRRSASHAVLDALRPLSQVEQKLVTLSSFPPTQSGCTVRTSDDSRMNTWAGVDTPSPNLKSLTS